MLLRWMAVRIQAPLVRVAMSFAATDRYSAASARLGGSLIHNLTPFGATSFWQVRKAARCRSWASISALRAAARSFYWCSDRVWILFFFRMKRSGGESEAMRGTSRPSGHIDTPLLPTTLSFILYASP